MWERDCDCIDIVRFSVPSPDTDDYHLYMSNPYREIKTYEWKRIIHPGEISRVRSLLSLNLTFSMLPFSDWAVSRGSTNQLNIWDLKSQINRSVKKTKNRSSTPNIMYRFLQLHHLDCFPATMIRSNCFLCLFMFIIQRILAQSSLPIEIASKPKVIQVKPIGLVSMDHSSQTTFKVQKINKTHKIKMIYTIPLQTRQFPPHLRIISLFPFLQPVKLVFMSGISRTYLLAKTAPIRSRLTYNPFILLFPSRTSPF